MTLKGMEVLAVRGASIAKKLQDKKIRHIEVLSKATAKILGFYSKDDFILQKNIMELGLDGDVNTRLLSRDELDAVLAAITGYLYQEGQVKTVGGEDGLVHIPEV